MQHNPTYEAIMDWIISSINEKQLLICLESMETYQKMGKLDTYETIKLQGAHDLKKRLLFPVRETPATTIVEAIEGGMIAQ